MKKLLLVFGVIMLASVSWGQPWGTSNSCLVVRSDKHHSRVLSEGTVPFSLHYSNRTLRQLSAEGVRIIVIGKHERMNSDACVAAMPAPIVRGFKGDISNPIGPAPIAPLAPLTRDSRECQEWMTKRSGESQCIEWFDKQK